MSADPSRAVAAPTTDQAPPSGGAGTSGDGGGPDNGKATGSTSARPSRLRVPKIIADRFNPPLMPTEPPVADGPAVTTQAPVAPSREVDLPPAPPTRPLTDNERAAAEQAARAASARAAAVTTRPVISAPTADSFSAPVVAPPVPEPVPPVGPPVARPAPQRLPRPARTLPPGETAAPIVAEPGPRLTRREQKRLGRVRARKVKRVLRHIEPWSVFKLSLLFYLCLFVTFMVAGTLLWNLAESAGTIQNVIDFLNDLGGGELTIEGRVIFRAALYGGLVLVVAGSFFNVLLAVLFNLISDLVGGIRVTVIEEETVRRGPAPARSGR